MTAGEPGYTVSRLLHTLGDILDLGAGNGGIH
jgi:tRNA1(Val) A37 N6-methylase TrmN6